MTKTLTAAELVYGTRIVTWGGAVKTVARVVDISEQFRHPHIRLEFFDGTSGSYLSTATFIAADAEA